MGEGFLDILRARDVSVGGLSVFVPHDFEGCDIHQSVALIITIPRSPSFMARGIVRHRSDTSHYFGIQITEIAPEHLRRLSNYVESRLAARAAV